MAIFSEHKSSTFQAFRLPHCSTFHPLISTLDSLLLPRYHYSRSEGPRLSLYYHRHPLSPWHHLSTTVRVRTRRILELTSYESRSSQVGLANASKVSWTKTKSIADPWDENLVSHRLGLLLFLIFISYWCQRKCWL